MSREKESRPVDELGYQEASDELDTIIAELDEGTIDVDALGERYQRAAEIAEELDRRIRANRARIEELAPRLERLGGDGDGDGDNDDGTDAEAGAEEMF